MSFASCYLEGQYTGSHDNYGGGFDWHGSGSGSGKGTGSGDGMGYGKGSGSGSGADYGKGSGSGSGADYGKGSGSGGGTGSGKGTGSGSGDACDANEKKFAKLSEKAEKYAAKAQEALDKGDYKKADKYFEKADKYDAKAAKYICDDNAAPEITAPTDPALTLAIQTAGVLTDVDAIDPDGDTIFFSIDPNSEDADLFSIDEETGVLSTSSPFGLGFFSADGDAFFEVTVVASDEFGGQDTLDLTVETIEFTGA